MVSLYSMDNVGVLFVLAANVHAYLNVRTLYPDKINDEKMTIVAREIAQRIENEMDYPGQIKINLIRESRAVEYAK